MSFYVYILHMAVGIVVGRIWNFDDLFIRSLVILGVSIAAYEICYLGCMAFQHFRKKKV